MLRLLLNTAIAMMLGTCFTPVLATESLNGAGATFPALLYTQWAAAYDQAKGITVNYAAVGSGIGIDRIKKHEVDFGASDVPLAPEELNRFGLRQFPVVVGGVVPVINIRGIKAGELKLTGSVLAEIYLGRIRKWNEKPIAELNPELQLPNVNITVVYRSDSSGSSMLWTNYLAQTSPAWKQQVGASLTPAWPIGVGSAGNEGVASYVQRTRYAIGYVEYTYARSHGLSDVLMRNHEGQFVRAGKEAFSAALAASDWKDKPVMGQLETDSAGISSWPITGASFILIPTAAEFSEKTLKVMKFFDWALHHGESIADHLDYTLIPSSMLDQ